MVTPVVKRLAVTHACETQGVSERRACRILCVVDEFSRECLGLIADTSLSGSRVARELDKIITISGKPRTVVSDNGTELTRMAILRWSRERAVD
jgi:putative transposase